MPELQQKSPSLFSNNKQSTVNNHKGTIISLTPIFILCDKCYWCSTYLDKTRLSVENDNVQTAILSIHCQVFLSCLMNHLPLIMMKSAA
jgi:hypothetical protein